MELRIGISSGYYYNTALTEINYGQMKADGYDCADINHFAEPEHPVYAMGEADLAAYMEKERTALCQAGIEPVQLHAVWPTDDTTPESREEKFRCLVKNIQMCRMLGCPNLVLHPEMPYGWERELDAKQAWQMNAALFQRLLPYAQAADVTLCLENMPFTSHTLAGVPKIVEFVDALDHPNLGICLDTGHAAVFGMQAGEMVRLVGNRLKALHVHDNNGVTDQHRLPCKGVIQWEDFRAALQETGFTGCVSLECGIDIHEPPEVLRERRIALVKTVLHLAGRG